MYVYKYIIRFVIIWYVSVCMCARMLNMFHHMTPQLYGVMGFTWCLAVNALGSSCCAWQRANMRTIGRPPPLEAKLCRIMCSHAHQQVCGGIAGGHHTRYRRRGSLTHQVFTRADMQVVKCGARAIVVARAALRRELAAGSPTSTLLPLIVCCRLCVVG